MTLWRGLAYGSGSAFVVLKGILIVRVFADDTKLAEFLDELPDDADRLIRRASLLVAMETRAALYDADPAGMPTDPDDIDAFAEATCLQVCEWVYAGVDPDRGLVGGEARVSSSSLDGASVSYIQPSDDAVKELCNSLCPSAVAVLMDAGLVGGLPCVY